MAAMSSNYVLLLIFHLLINYSSGISAVSSTAADDDTAFPVIPTPTNPTQTPVVYPTPPNPTTINPTPPFPFPVPVTPVPVTNPATISPPPPPPGIPATIPTTNPPPVTSTASPAIPGQSWCVAKAGAAEAALQAGLDYACGSGRADCTQIQMGASCYNPNTVQNHASYAFNSYYQRNPVAMSCDFGGAATVVATNPRYGSCIYPAYSQTSPLGPAATTTPAQPTPTPTTESMSPPLTGAVPVPVQGSGTPPAAPNTGNPVPVSGNPPPFSGLEGTPPPAMATQASMSARVRPYVGCSVILLISLVLQNRT